MTDVWSLGRLLGKFFTANIIFGSCMFYACRKKNQILKTMDKELLNKMCSCSWLYQMLSLLRQKGKLFYQWAFCFFPSLLVLARLCPVKYLTDGLVGIAFTLPTLDCFSFLHLFWTRYWISKKAKSGQILLLIENFLLENKDKYLQLPIKTHRFMANFPWYIFSFVKLYLTFY